jgi:hypothetical protein
MLTLDINMRALTMIFDKNDMNTARDLCFCSTFFRIFFSFLYMSSTLMN